MIAVSGGTGFLGAHLLVKLCEKYDFVRAFKRNSSSLDLVQKVFEIYSSNPQNIHKIEWFEADVNDVPALEDGLQGVEIFYHCAGMVSFQKKDRDQMFHINAVGTANVINASLYCGVKKICHVSSIAALGRAFLDEPIHENTPWKSSSNNSNYAVSKYLAEREVWRGTEEGLDAVIVNPGLILGFGDWNSGTASLFTKINKGLNFYTEGSNGVVDVRNVAEIMILLTESEIKNERFILVSENIPYRKLADLIADNLHKKRAERKASKFTLQLAVALESIRAKITGTHALITKESVQNAQAKSVYDNSKLQNFIDFKYRSVENTIKETAELFIKKIG